VYVAAMLVDGGDVYLKHMSEFQLSPSTMRSSSPPMATSLSGPRRPWMFQVLCVRDRTIHPDFQRRMSTRAGEVVTLDTDHSPFMSSPEQFAELMDGFANKANASAGIT
jgi:hypothetical protein